MLDPNPMPHFRPRRRIINLFGEPSFRSTYHLKSLFPPYEEEDARKNTLVNRFISILSAHPLFDHLPISEPRLRFLSWGTVRRG